MFILDERWLILDRMNLKTMHEQPARNVVLLSRSRMSFACVFDCLTRVVVALAWNASTELVADSVVVSECYTLFFVDRDQDCFFGCDRSARRSYVADIRASSMLRSLARCCAAIADLVPLMI